MLRVWKPSRPVYCIYPQQYSSAATEFIAAFPGRVLYAVKANSHPETLRLLHEAGIRHFDCASLPEIELVHRVCSQTTCYFMTPVRLRGAAGQAQAKYGVRHFMIDHPSGLLPLVEEIDAGNSVIFARMAVHHSSASADLSSKFGAPPHDIPDLLSGIAATGAEPALAFNVGSAVKSPDAYAHSIQIAGNVLADVSQAIRLVDIGGGFAKPYPGFPVPPVAEYIHVIKNNVDKLMLADDGEILCEPGRALAAPGLSALVEVLLIKDEYLYLNDGMYGIFWELRCEGHDRYPVRCFRGCDEVNGDIKSFRLFGPTCDVWDRLPGEVSLPADIRVGDYLEFGCVGAYSLSGRTDFNGHHSDQIVNITDDIPPSV
jgi:ornithine decarboxylase